MKTAECSRSLAHRLIVCLEFHTGTSRFGIFTAPPSTKVGTFFSDWDQENTFYKAPLFCARRHSAGRRVPRDRQEVGGGETDRRAIVADRFVAMGCCTRCVRRELQRCRVRPRPTDRRIGPELGSFRTPPPASPPIERSLTSPFPAASPRPPRLVSSLEPNLRSTPRSTPKRRGGRRALILEDDFGERSPSPDFPGEEHDEFVDAFDTIDEYEGLRTPRASTNSGTVPSPVFEAMADSPFHDLTPQEQVARVESEGGIPYELCRQSWTRRCTRAGSPSS